MRVVEALLFIFVFAPFCEIKILKLTYRFSFFFYAYLPDWFCYTVRICDAEYR